MSEHPKQRDNSQEPEKRGDANYTWPIASKKTENDNAPNSTELCQLCGISIWQEHPMQACHGCLQ